jgi:outer membrane biosynthesis protein TonB
MVVVRNLAPAAAWLMLAAGTSGCAVLHARSRPLGPPLEMPPPPARVVPIESQPIVVEAPTVDDVPKPEPSLAPEKPPPPARVDREPSPPARSEAPAEAGAATPAAPTPAPAPPPALQTTANPTEAEQRTRDALGNAKRDLGRIDLKRLNREARSQYDIARRFVEQAEEALRARNPVFAEQLADKAATLAALLQKQ